MKVEQTECFKTLAYNIKMLENYPEESVQQKKKKLGGLRRSVIMFKSVVNVVCGSHFLFDFGLIFSV